MRLKKGFVSSAKQNKTVVVTVHTKKLHPVLGKTYRVSTKFHAHDESNECNEGDEVIISETRPLSRLKRWKVDKIVKKAFQTVKIDDMEEVKSVLHKEEQTEEKEESSPEVK